jgi:hypothetical protein
MFKMFKVVVALACLAAVNAAVWTNCGTAS